MKKLLKRIIDNEITLSEMCKLLRPEDRSFQQP